MAVTGHRGANGSRSRRMPPVPWAGQHKVLAALASALVVAAVAGVTAVMLSSSSRASVPRSTRRRALGPAGRPGVVFRYQRFEMAHRPGCPSCSIT